VYVAKSIVVVSSRFDEYRLSFWQSIFIEPWTHYDNGFVYILRNVQYQITSVVFAYKICIARQLKIISLLKYNFVNHLKHIFFNSKLTSHRMSSDNFDPVEYEYLRNVTSYYNYAQAYIRSNSVTYVQILVMVVYVPTACAAFIGNVVILAAFWIYRKELLKVNFNLFIINLSFIDLLVAVADMPFSTILQYKKNFWPKYSKFGCAMILFDDWILTLLSMMTLVGISIDRYWAACWSQHYRIHNKRVLLHTYLRRLYMVCNVKICMIFLFTTE